MSFAAQSPPPDDACDDLIRQLESLRHAIGEDSGPGSDILRDLPPGRHQSARNLFHYLALRSRDLRPLQDRLVRLGLSSLGRAEPNVQATLDAILNNLYLLSGRERSTTDISGTSAAFDAGTDCLEQNTFSLLGRYPENRRVHIVVTMPAEAADDYLLVHQLLRSGMDCMRINCSHDDPSTWSRIIEHLRYAERATGKTCRILMDLGGPKLRTGPMEKEPAVLKIRPVRAANGQILRPARIWLTSTGASQSESCTADASLAVDPAWLQYAVVGSEVRFRDARGSRRRWRIREATGDGCWAEADKTAYVTNGSKLQLRGKVSGNDRKTGITGLPPQDSVILVRAGDTLILSGREEPGSPEIHDDNGDLLSAGRVSLPIPEIYRDSRPGEPVCFDDGRIRGMVERLDGDELQIRITHTRKVVEKLGSDKGVNFPDTRLDLPALSAKDLQDLEFAAENADMVGLSFANRPDDIRALREQLHKLGHPEVGMVVKIETKRGFNNLPVILLEALKFSACGVMIARGDLAVECGFERMAELQEEILWVCEAAHVPVIWATQVLEGLTKRGQASRAEITDAAMGQAAEAVMLNKGTHITEAVAVLDDILQRMQGHHSKKRSMMRKLDLASGFKMPGN